MRSRKMRGSLFSFAIAISLVSIASASQSGAEFVDPDGKYKLNLVGDWKAVTYNDAVGRQKTEFVYRDRSEGLLKISTEKLSGKSVEDMVRQEEESFKNYRPGFQRIALEQFGGALKGMLLSFQTTESGRNTTSAFYYLQDGNNVWVLKFTGKRGTLDVNRNLTDQIARSFKIN